jgi:hypothetical protein
MASRNGAVGRPLSSTVADHVAAPAVNAVGVTVKATY